MLQIVYGPFVDNIATELRSFGVNGTVSAQMFESRQEISYVLARYGLPPIRVSVHVNMLKNADAIGHVVNLFLEKLTKP